MKRIKLIISYDGTNYVGWQVQKNGIAVEEVINKHLSKLLKEDITIVGASRTDSGVHALGNVAVFDTNTRIPSEKIALALNQSLPDDIKIVKSEEVPADFHPRYTDCTKTYQYNILNSRVNFPLQRLYTDYVYYELDVEKMRQAAEYLIGEHDFKAFSSAGGQQKSSIRTIYTIDISFEYLEGDKGTVLLSHFSGEDDKGTVLLSHFSGEDQMNSVVQENVTKEPSPCHQENVTKEPSPCHPCHFLPKLVHITISGNGFLYNMVRIIAGTLEKVGMGIYPPEHVKEILDSCDRRLSAPKAPARGLTLLKIEY